MQEQNKHSRIDATTSSNEHWKLENLIIDDHGVSSVVVVFEKHQKDPSGRLDMRSLVYMYAHEQDKIMDGGPWGGHNP